MNVLYVLWIDEPTLNGTLCVWTPSRNLDLPSLQAEGEWEEAAAQESRSDQTSICKANWKAQK